jgi:hypothetical protein
MKNRLNTPLTIGGFFLAAFVLTVSLLATPTSAQEGTGQALEIAPPVLNLSGDPGQTVEAEIILRDVSDSPLIVTNQINDFVASGEDGTPRILLNNDDEESPYSMREWFNPISEFTLEPRTLTRLPITLNIPSNTAPGGYFSVIRFTGTPPEVSGNGVGLSASIGALVFVNVNGDAKEELSIEEFYTSIGDRRSGLFQTAPVDFNVRLNNTGNTYEQPSGQIKVTDMFGNTVATVNVNLPPRNVLPGSIRKFEAPLDSSVIGNKILFGLYTADLTVTYGENEQPITERVTFWVIPYTLIGIIILALIVGFFVLRTMIRRYNQHIIKQASKKRK